MRKLLNIEVVVSLFFVFCLSVPFMVSIVEDDIEISASEKRKLEKFPEISLNSDMLDEFPGQFESYYNDHFGFRSRIVRLHNYVLAKVFGVSPTPMVVIGRNDWYFFDADGAISDYIGRVNYSDNNLERFSTLLQDRKRWLDSMGIQYLFLPVPNKVNVYGDELPLRIRRYAGVTKYEQIVQHLKNSGEFDNVIDSQEILREGKKERRMYLQTDSHWNYDGAYLVYREIIRRLQAELPDIVPLKQAPQKEWIENFSGDLAILMNLRGLITETAPKNIVEMGCEQTTGRYMTGLKKIPLYSDMPGHRLPVVTGCKERSYKAIVIHDSFGKFLKPYLTQHFKKVIYVNYMNFEKAKLLIEREKPDVVIDQRAARNLQRALQPDPELQQLMLRREFDAKEKLLSEMDGVALTAAIVENRNVTTTLARESLTANFAGNKSTLALQVSLGSDLDGNAAVRLNGHSNHAMNARICYYPGSKEHRGEQQCVDRVFEQGENEIMVRILNPEPEGVLSIVSSGAGSVSLKRLTARPN